MSESKMKLTPAQLKALKHAKLNYGTMALRQQTGEALLRRGLLDRYTIHIIRAEYVTHNGSTDQGSGSRQTPYQQHEWYITARGCEALANHCDEPL